uniref:BH3-interacting domain death agonist n=1 Tax=Pan paniscus TaxID=9597 RepID=A0A2R9A786_PANPA|nr:BH3-interacting domain death agonist isoform X1 [Pan paniscus]
MCSGAGVMMARWAARGRAGCRSTVRILSPLGHCEPGVSRSCRAAQAMDCEVNNGSGLRDECITNLLVFGFLQSCSDNSFRRELDALGHELPVLAPQWEGYDELQTDGNRSSHSRLGRIEADSESQEDIIRNIARHLAQVGDSMDRSIPPGLVNGLALQLRNTSRSEEDRNRDLATALEQLLQAYPRDMEKEKTMLVLALLLAKKVASHTPSLLRDVFHTTVNFINQNLRTYVRSLARNGMD